MYSSEWTPCQQQRLNAWGVHRHIYIHVHVVYVCNCNLHSEQAAAASYKLYMLEKCVHGPVYAGCSKQLHVQNAWRAAAAAEHTCLYTNQLHTHACDSRI